MMRFFLLTLFIIFSIQVFSDENVDLNELDKKYLVVDGPYIKKSKRLLNKQIRKTVMSIIFKGKEYTLLLNNKLDFNKSELNVFRVIITGKRKRKKNKTARYDLKLELTSDNNKEVINRIIEKNILERHILFRVRSMTHKLINGEMLKDSVSQRKKIINKKNKEKSIKNKTKNVSKTPSSKDKPNKDQLNNKILNGLEEVFELSPDEIAELDRKKTKAKKKKKKKVTLANFSSPDLDLTKNLPPEVKRKKGFKAYYDFSYGLGYERESLVSKTVVSIGGNKNPFEVDNDLALMQFFIRANARLEADDEMGLTTELRISKIMGETDYSVKAPMSLDFYMFRTFSFAPITLKFGFKYETYSFANLGFSSKGIQPWSSKLLWYNWSGETRLPFIHPNIQVGVEMGKVFNGTTDHRSDESNVALDGSRFGFYIKSRIWNKYSIEVKKMKISSSSLGATFLDNQQNQVIITLLYN